MKVVNLENTEEFHLPNETAKALISAGVVRKAETPEPVLYPTDWSIQTQFKISPIIRAKCPNCNSESSWESAAGNAHKNKFYHVCFGKPEPVPEHIVAQYLGEYRDYVRVHGKGKPVDRYTKVGEVAMHGLR